MHFKFLADVPDAIPVIARWHFDEWWHLTGHHSASDVEEVLLKYLNTDRIPLMVLALDDTRVIGTASVKFQEMAMFPEKEHWLGGVYVDADYRGRGVGGQIVAEAVRLAATLGVQTLHLQTEDLTGGLYARMGWQPKEKAHHHGIDVLVMERNLGAQYS